ncbi:hypothetical protein K469DRAFT_361496 [Zopfia rhizophila CBS 207.26]|uniref:Uncharacterized protein n=1 Tax=Zopfia rhizophila CBS 207.26 TaxID=1314779 RepID=A0A6A6EJA5_9PEZI|nr:hypothetical protein K469DRAFT_361496 [Zopfia rhizophila CBS 207.26]
MGDTTRVEELGGGRFRREGDPTHWLFISRSDGNDVVLRVLRISGVQPKKHLPLPVQLVSFGGLPTNKFRLQKPPLRSLTEMVRVANLGCLSTSRCSPQHQIEVEMVLSVIFRPQTSASERSHLSFATMDIGGEASSSLCAYTAYPHPQRIQSHPGRKQWR